MNRDDVPAIVKHANSATAQAEPTNQPSVLASMVLCGILTFACCSSTALGDDTDTSSDNPYHPATESDFRALELEAIARGFELVDPAEKKKVVLVEYTGDDVDREVEKALAAYRTALLPVAKTVTVFDLSTLCSSPSREDDPLFVAVAGFVAIDAPRDYLYYGRRVIEPPDEEQIARDLAEFFKGTTYQLPVDGAIAIYGGKGRGTKFAADEFSANRFNLKSNLNYHPLESVAFRGPLEFSFHDIRNDDEPLWVFEKKFDSVVKYQDGSVRLQFRPKNNPGTIGEIGLKGDPLLPVSYSLFFETGFERYGRKWKSKSLSFTMRAQWEQDDEKQWFIRAAQTKQFQRSGDPQHKRSFVSTIETKRMSKTNPRFGRFFEDEKFGQDVPPIAFGDQK